MWEEEAVQSEASLRCMTTFLSLWIHTARPNGVLGIRSHMNMLKMPSKLGVYPIYSCMAASATPLLRLLFRPDNGVFWPSVYSLRYSSYVAKRLSHMQYALKHVY